MRSDAAIQTSQVTSSSPKTLREAEAGAGQPSEDERGQRRGQQAHHLDQQRRARAQRALRAGRVPWLGPCRSTSSIADLPLHIDGYALEAAGPHRLLRLRARVHRDRAAGRRRDGPRRGRDLRARGPRRPAGGRAGAASWPASGRSTRSPSTSATLDLFPGFTPQQEVYRRYRRWGFESAALDLALRQDGTSLHALLGRDAGAGDVRRLLAHGRAADARPGHAPARRATRTSASSSTRTPDWTDELIDGAAGDRRGRLDRLQGRLQGHGRRRRDRPGVLPPDRRGVPGRLARGSRTSTTRRRCTRSPPFQDRITWDAPIHSVEDILAAQGDPAHGQPQAVAVRLA